MKSYRTSKGGFTLVEILIVVIILGILAAIVIPQFTNASTDARNNSTTSLLQTIRSQIELYKLQHTDTLPDLITDWTGLTQTSTVSGVTVGPYLQQDPSNPQNGNSKVVAASSAAGAFTADATAGFVYHYGTAGNGTGKFWATNAAGSALHAE